MKPIPDPCFLTSESGFHLPHLLLMVPRAGDSGRMIPKSGCRFFDKIMRKYIV
jgi:hypothetical protein